MLDGLWPVLGETWPLSLPRRPFCDATGEPAVRWMERLGLVHRSRLEAGSAFPCPSYSGEDCPREVYQARTGLRARCGHHQARCPDVAIEADDAWQLTVMSDTLIPVLQAALMLRQAPETESGVVLLGERRFGSTVLEFVLVPDPTHPDTVRWFHQMADRDPRRHQAALVFDQANVPVARDPRVVWLVLADGLALADRLVLDLLPLWERFAPDDDPGSDVWPRCLFAADPARGLFRYAGVLLDLRRRPLAARLLTALLWFHGVFLTQQRLLALLYPERLGADVADPGEPVRKTKYGLAKLIRGLELPSGILDEPIQTLEGRSDTEGGYAIVVAPSRTHWVSRPDREILNA